MKDEKHLNYSIYLNNQCDFFMFLTTFLVFSRLMYVLLCLKVPLGNQYQVSVI